MPKQNRSLVRDGRIQAPKKRTDRSYLRPSSGATEIVSADDVEMDEPSDALETPVATEASMKPAAAFAPPAPKPVAPAPVGKLPTAVRALQQQGAQIDKARSSAGGRAPPPPGPDLDLSLLGGSKWLDNFSLSRLFRRKR